jgi:hypothetical protein
MEDDRQEQIGADGYQISTSLPSIDTEGLEIKYINIYTNTA